MNTSKEAVNTNFKVIGLTRLGIKPKSTAPGADAHTTRPSELLNKKQEKRGENLLFWKSHSYVDLDLLKKRSSPCFPIRVLPAASTVFQIWLFV